MSYTSMQLTYELKGRLESLKDYRFNTLPKVLDDLLNTKERYNALQSDFAKYRVQAQSDADERVATMRQNSVETGADTKAAIKDLAALLSLTEPQTIEFLLDHYHMSHSIDKATFVMWMDKRRGGI